MDRAVKAALLAVTGIALFVLAVVAVPRTVASWVMELDVPGEGAFAALAFAAVTLGIGAFAWSWGAMVRRVLQSPERAGRAEQPVEGETDDDLHERG